MLWSAFLVLAGLPTLAHASPERPELHQDIHVQCRGRLDRTIFVAPRGGQSFALCRDLLQRCANAAGVEEAYSPVPVRVPPPYRVCH